MNGDIIKRAERSIMAKGIDRVVRDGMSEPEVRIFLKLLEDGIPAEQVAFRIFDNVFMVVTRLRDNQSLSLSFDAAHIPGILAEKDYKLIADGIISFYRQPVVIEPNPMLKE